MKYFIKEWIVPIVIALVIVLFLNKFIFILVTVPTGSMENTIIPGDRLYVNELFNMEDAQRGDILVFRSEELENKRLVKRLIGLPGETIEVKEDGSVIINGEKLKEPYAAESAGQAKSFEIPEGYELEIRGRSGNAFKYRVFSFNGTIDSDYRGEVKLLLMNFGDQPISFEAGERVAQGVIKRIKQVRFLESVELSETERGENGLGSTGLKS